MTPSNARRCCAAAMRQPASVSAPASTNRRRSITPPMAWGATGTTTCSAARACSYGSITASMSASRPGSTSMINAVSSITTMLMTCPPGNPRNQFRQSAYSAYLEAAVTDRLSSRLEAGRSSTRIKAIGAAQPWNRNSNETERDSLSWLNLFRLSDNQSLTLAADWYEDQLESDQSYSEPSRHNRGLFAQYQTRLD